ncbi:hypothetical protein ACIRQY_34710 [Streptomyces sp. NPDC101490]|uniref:hypothetical protein n=1 Tax=Streptomyces sp. NPDC101490 TaxID=3366143 RepID=UPI0038131A56
MNRTLLLSLAGAIVLSGSAAAYVALDDGTVTVSASCVPVMENDRDRAGLTNTFAVVTVDQTVKVTAYADHREALSKIRVVEVLKGNLPAALEVTQIVGQNPDGTLTSVAERKAALRPGHQYVIGIAEAPEPTSDVWLSTPADGPALDTSRAHWKDAIAHQNPPRSDPRCASDVVVK